MKTILKNTYLLLMTALTIGFTACSDDNCSDMQLDGDTWITAISMDEYAGTIDRTDKTVVIPVPETYNVSAMKLTSLQLSEGATGSMEPGDIMDMNFPQVLRVMNGDVFLDYTLTVKHDEAKILSFKLNDTYVGVINQETLTITVRVPGGTDLTSMVPTIVTTEGASVEPQSGVSSDYTQPVSFVVKYNTASALYTVIVIESDAPSAAYVGLASSLDQLNPEERTAAEWMLNNVPNSQYISFADIIGDKVDLSQCRILWWHLHIDGGIDNMDKFDQAAPDAVSAMVKVRELYESGTNLLLTRYATYYAAKIGATLDGRNPNNCWGQVESEAETAGGAWYFFNQGHTDHAIYQGLIQGSDANGVYMFDAGYRTTNSTAQWHLGTDWGGYADEATWENQHGGKALGYGGDGAVVLWEYPAADAKGGIICIGSGCYDWYAEGVDASADAYHANVATMTLNAINYLNE